MCLDRITKFEDSDAFTATHLDLVAWIYISGARNR